MKTKLITGKRYMWPVHANVKGTRWVNGLFTGEYDNVTKEAILVTKDGERWRVPVDKCQLMPKR